jgi:gas vesicle protein
VRFVLGVAIGLGAGFAVAILFAPQKKDRATWTPRSAHDPESKPPSWLDDVRDRFDEALMEAEEVRKETEREMNKRYQKAIKRTPDVG